MNSGGPFIIKVSGHVKDLLHKLREQSETLELEVMVGRSLLEIEGHLELDPRAWGDPVKDLDHLNQVMYRRLFDNLKVEYSVHRTESLVWLLLIEPVLGHPLCQNH